MFGYVMIGINDIDKVCVFYDVFFVEFGVKQMFGQDCIKFYGDGKGLMFVVCILYDENEQYQGNGNMVVILVFKENVDKLYVKVFEFGVICDGELGDCIFNVFYGVYVCDFDGNKFCFYEMNM